MKIKIVLLIALIIKSLNCFDPLGYVYGKIENFILQSPISDENKFLGQGSFNVFKSAINCWNNPFIKESVDQRAEELKQFGMLNAKSMYNDTWFFVLGIASTTMGALMIKQLFYNICRNSEIREKFNKKFQELYDQKKSTPEIVIQLKKFVAENNKKILKNILNYIEKAVDSFVLLAMIFHFMECENNHFFKLSYSLQMPNGNYKIFLIKKYIFSFMALGLGHLVRKKINEYCADLLYYIAEKTYSLQINEKTVKEMIENYEVKLKEIDNSSLKNS
jgi:hypothetical protein